MVSFLTKCPIRKQLMHYSKHRLTASVVQLTTLTNASTNDQ